MFAETADEAPPTAAPAAPEAAAAAPEAAAAAPGAQQEGGGAAQGQAHAATRRSAGPAPAGPPLFIAGNHIQRPQRLRKLSEDQQKIRRKVVTCHPNNAAPAQLSN